MSEKWSCNRADEILYQRRRAMRQIIKGVLVSCLALLLVCIDSRIGFTLQYSNWEIGGYIRNETSLKLGDDTDEPIWIENILQLEIVNHLTDNMDLFLMTRAYYDAVYDAKDGGFLKDSSVRRELRDKYGSHRKDTQADAIREAYIDIFLEDFDIRVGKQQIVWGKTEGFKMLDIINPTDYRHFVQDSFEDSRITLWAARIDWAIGLNNLLELVIIPDVEPNLAPPYGHPFAFRVNRETDPSTVIVLKDNKSWQFKNTEWGLRWGQNLGSFDYTLNYFYHWTDNPYVKFQGLSLDFTHGIRPILLYDYKRMHSIGGSFSKNFTEFLGLKHVVLRGETVLRLEDAGAKLSAAGTAEPIRTDSFNYALALDHTFYRPYRLWPTGLSVTFQFFQSVVLDYENSYINGATSTQTDPVELDEVDNTLTLSFMSNYLPGEVLKTFFLISYGDDNEWWFFPKLSYELTEKTTVSLGAHIYAGPADGFIGQMRKNNNIFMQIKFGI